MPRGERFVVLGLAGPRSTWFTEVSRWSTSGSAPLEFVKCLSIDEVRARIGGGRAHSALLVAGSTPGLDVDLVTELAATGCATLVVDDGAGSRRWDGFGVAAVIAEPFGRDELVAVLQAHATAVAGVVTAGGVPGAGAADPGGGSLVAVTGAGGTGASVAAMALAQGLAERRVEESVLLADLALGADQGVLHDADDVVPGLVELVEVCRRGVVDDDVVVAQTMTGVDRRYRLLLGLRRPDDWVLLRPVAVRAAIDGLLRVFDLVVADVDSDVAGQRESGSVDLEERNALARTTLLRADVIVVTVRPDPHGLRRGAVLVAALVAAGVAAARIQPAVGVTDRRSFAPAERAWPTLVERAAGPGVATSAAVPLRHSRRTAAAVRDGRALSSGAASSVARAVEAHLRSIRPAPVAPPAERVVPGTLGHW